MVIIHGLQYSIKPTKDVGGGMLKSTVLELAETACDEIVDPSAEAEVGGEDQFLLSQLVMAT